MRKELLKLGYSNISYIEDQCAFSSVVISTELEVSIEKKDYFLTFLLERKKNYISIQREHSIRFKQLIVKEILVNGPWRLDFMVPQRS